jgi:hypothetical protein
MKMIATLKAPRVLSQNPSLVVTQMVSSLPMLKYVMLSLSSVNMMYCLSQVTDILPSKTIPSTGCGASAKRTIADEETEDLNDLDDGSSSKDVGKRGTKTTVCSPQHIVDQI